MAALIQHLGFVADFCKHAEQHNFDYRMRDVLHALQEQSVPSTTSAGCAEPPEVGAHPSAPLVVGRLTVSTSFASLR
jgi:hypothetical protein